MNTLFECWNAGVIEWDGLSTPKLSFSFPCLSHEQLAFFLVSARLNQLLGKQEWQLSFAGQPYAVPSFPALDMSRLLRQIPARFGYAPNLKLISPVANEKEMVLPLMQWIHLASGCIYSYAPFLGRRCAHQQSRKNFRVVVASCDELAVEFDRSGRLIGQGDRGVMDRLEICHHRSFQTAIMLSQYFKAQSSQAKRLY